MPGAPETVDLHFPFAGVHVQGAFSEQPNRPAWRGEYARTTPVGVNVRGREPGTLRTRGGSRAGLKKWIATRPGNVEYVTQMLGCVVSSGFTPPGGQVPPASQSGRIVTVVDVSLGNVYAAVSGPDRVWSSTTNNTGETPPLNASGLVRWAANRERMFFADGTNWCYFDPRANTVYPWFATAGALPIDSADNTPRLICAWRTRIVLSGLLLDPATVFMSRLADEFNFDYAPLSPSGADAFAQNVGDAVTCLIPYSDDILIVGMDHTIKIYRGDPAAGGQLDLVTDSIGMAWGTPWCMDTAGVVYFMSNRMQVYAMDPRTGGKPVRISQSIQNLLGTVNTGTKGIVMCWEDRFGGLYAFITTLAGATASDEHFFWEQEPNAWWQDVFANPAHNPLCCLVLDGNLPDDRTILVGGTDGYVRQIDTDADSDDDGWPIASEVWIGPFLTKYADEVKLGEVQGVLATGSGDVNYEVRVGQTAEEAVSSAAVASGTWSAGRNFTDSVDRAGYAAYLRLTSAVRWAFEQARCTVRDLGMTRRRGK